MSSISFAVVLNENLKKSPLYVDQIEAVIDIKGAEADPLTLQQIRDEPSIKDCFQARRANINGLIATYSADLRKAKTEKIANELLKAFNQKLQSEVRTLETQLQQRADAFAQKQKKDVNDLFWARAKLTARVLWSAAKVVKGGLEAATKVTAAMSGGIFLSVVALKAVVATLNDAWGTVQEFVGAWKDERALHAKLEAAAKELKKYKKPQAVPQGAIDEIERLLGPYGAKLLGAGESAKKLAVKLDKLLNDLSKGKFRDEAAQKAAEDQVDLLIQKIQKTSQNIAEGRKLVQSARAKVADASKRAKADPKSWWDLAGALWKVFDAGLDMTEEAMGAESWSEAFKKCHDVVKGKIDDEIKDAMVEEATAL